MIRRNSIVRLSLAAALVLSAPVVFAQDIHFTQFDMQPLVLNPAFTGMFDGQVRAGAIYRNQWGSVTVPYVTFGGYVDVPLIIESNGDYLAAGLQMFKDQAGDGNLSNTTGLLSLAYHKSFGQSEHSSNDLAVGLQGGYAQKSVDLSRLYFGDEWLNGTWTKGQSQEYHLGLGNSVNYYLVNAGVSFAHGGDKVSYVIGAAANNLNQPNDAIEKKQSSNNTLDMRYTGELGINWIAGDRLSLRPAVLFQSQATATELIAGTEFHYALSTNPDGQSYENFSSAFYLGGWYRSGDAAMITAGVEFKGFRIGVGYDYNISSLNAANNGNGGMELAIRYIAPSPIRFAKKRTIPCGRF